MQATLVHLVLGHQEVANTAVEALLNAEIEIISLHEALEILESFIEHRPQILNVASWLEKVHDELFKRILK